MTLFRVQARSRLLKAATVTKTERIGGVLWRLIDAKISPKEALEKAQTTVPENRYIQGLSFLLLASTRNNVRASFWYTRYHVPPLQSCSITECLRSFLSAVECPIIPVI